MFEEEIKRIKLYKKTKKASENRLRVLLAMFSFFLVTFFVHKFFLNDLVSFFPVFIFEILVASIFFAWSMNKAKKRGLLELPRLEEEFLRSSNLTTRLLYLEKYYGVEDISFEERVYFLGVLNKISSENDMEVLTNCLELKIISDPKKGYLKEALLERINKITSTETVDDKSDIEVLENALNRLKEKNKVEETNTSSITND